MEVENSKEFKVAKELINVTMNDYGWNADNFAKGIICGHRTMQQTFMRTLVATIREMAAAGYDLRNRQAHDLAVRMVESGILDEFSMTMI